MKRLLRSEKGFTLVELIVVVAIVAVLAAMFIPDLLGHRVDAEVSRARDDIASMRGAVEKYAVEEGSYPEIEEEENDVFKDALEEEGLLGAGGDIPEDPWGEEYNYSESDGEFVIYTEEVDASYEVDDETTYSNFQVYYYSGYASVYIEDDGDPSDELN